VTIKKRVEEFLKWFEKQNLDAKKYKKLTAQIEKYWDKLFADPIEIEIETPEGKVLIQPQRTNNILERFFRAFRRLYRKRTGYNSINKLLKTILADTPLVQNL